MTDWGTRRYRWARRLGRITARLSAALTLGRMPPFVSASAVVVHDGQVLMVVDPIRQEPVLPGGHLKWDEDPRDAVIREVQEETGLVVRPTRIVGVFSGAKWAGERGVVRVIYSAQWTSGDLKSSPEGEALWTPVEAAVSSSSRDTPIIQVYLTSLVEATLPR